MLAVAKVLAAMDMLPLTLSMHVNIDLYIPDQISAPEAQARTSHLGIGAHQDDLEFMACLLYTSDAADES